MFTQSPSFIENMACHHRKTNRLCHLFPHFSKREYNYRYVNFHSSSLSYYKAMCFQKMHLKYAPYISLKCNIGTNTNNNRACIDQSLRKSGDKC